MTVEDLVNVVCRSTYQINIWLCFLVVNSLLAAINIYTSIYVSLMFNVYLKLYDPWWLFCMLCGTIFFLSLQQHGSVYWKKGSKLKLNKLKPLASLHDQLKVNNDSFWKLVKENLTLMEYSCYSSFQSNIFGCTFKHFKICYQYIFILE